MKLFDKMSIVNTKEEPPVKKSVFKFENTRKAAENNGII